MEKVNTSIRLRQIMQERGLKQADILRLCAPISAKYGAKFGKSALSQYVSGRVEPSQTPLFILAQALNVNEAWLMGYDVPRERSPRPSPEPEISDIPGVMPIRKKAFPLLGRIACGEPAYAEEEHETWITATDDIDADFCIRAAGDSMNGAHIEDGDIVFIKQASVVDSGRIAAVLIGDEMTLKYCDWRPAENLLILTPANPAYRTQVYAGEQLNTIRILGLAVRLQKDLIK